LWFLLPLSLLKIPHPEKLPRGRSCQSSNFLLFKGGNEVTILSEKIDTVHFKLIETPKKDLKKVWDCRDCSSSCQSACKTSCTLANQVCQRENE
jgi:predicted ribosomally synthesized six-cysteine peptide SCIFF